MNDDLLSFAAGAAAGLALGVLLSRAAPSPRRLGSEIRERAREVGRRLQPMRLRRYPLEQVELDRLESAVLDAFMEDPILGERGVEIGAISAGIIELSGAVGGEEEVQRAVSLASSIPGVRTVLNRLDLESHRRPSTRRQLDEDDLSSTFLRGGSRFGGMGRRRQSSETDPERPDDSQKMGEDALADADRDQFVDEGFVNRGPRMAARDEDHPEGSRYDEDELDNQDPHDKHARGSFDRPAEQLNSDARVGEGMKPGTELEMERSEIRAEPRRSAGEGHSDRGD